MTLATESSDRMYLNVYVPQLQHEQDVVALITEGSLSQPWPSIRSFFSAPCLEWDGAAIKIPRHKAMVLLSCLAATGKMHARDSRAAIFWPDCPDFDDWQAFVAESLRRRLRTMLEELAAASERGVGIELNTVLDELLVVARSISIVRL